LQATLANIEDARPFDQLTTEDVAKAHPRIAEAVETMVKKGKWTVPGMCVPLKSIVTICSYTIHRIQGEVRRPQPHVISAYYFRSVNCNIPFITGHPQLGIERRRSLRGRRS
jgi:hypothetical protein